MKGNDSYLSLPTGIGKGQQRIGPLTAVTIGALLRRRARARRLERMEFLNFLIILWTAWLLWRRPERERLAFRLFVISCLLMALCFFIGSHGSLVPGVNL